MVSKLLAIAAALFLSACACTAPAIVSEPKETLTPVVKKCIDKADIPETPEFPLDAVDLSNPNEALARFANAARLERKVRRDYIGKVQKVFQKCSE